MVLVCGGGRMTQPTQIHRAHPLELPAAAQDTNDRPTQAEDVPATTLRRRDVAMMTWHHNPASPGHNPITHGRADSRRPGHNPITPKTVTQS